MRQPAQRPGILRPPMPVDHYENFPVASFLLPAHLREPVEAIYAFARSADQPSGPSVATCTRSGRAAVQSARSRRAVL